MGTVEKSVPSGILLEASLPTSSLMAFRADAVSCHWQCYPLFLLYSIIDASAVAEFRLHVMNETWPVLIGLTVSDNSYLVGDQEADSQNCTDEQALGDQMMSQL